jgi:hypothetical protein
MQGFSSIVRRGKDSKGSLPRLKPIPRVKDLITFQARWDTVKVVRSKEQGNQQNGNGQYPTANDRARI